MRHRNYRLLWTGTLISHSGDWLDQIALNWLVMEQTGSAFYLGLVNLCRGLPIFVLTLVGGAVADRVERRRLMMVTQGSAMVLATMLAILALAGNPPIWAILLVATARGSVIAFNLPARHALISELVPRADLPNALALNSVTNNLTKVLGPLLAGVIIATWGTATCFVINAASFVAVLWTLALMRFPPRAPAAPAPAGRLSDSILSGIRFVAGHRTILLLVLVSLVPTFVGHPFIQLLAVFAHEVFDSGPVGLGVLTAAASVGSVLGALAMAAFTSALRRGLALLVMLMGFGVALCLFALNPSEVLAPVILAAAGALYISYSAVHQTLLQMTVPDAYRGRVLSTLFLNRGMMSLGTATAATLASLAGARAAYAAMGATILIFAAVLLIAAPRLRALRV